MRVEQWDGTVLLDHVHPAETPTLDAAYKKVVQEDLGTDHRFSLTVGWSEEMTTCQSALLEQASAMLCTALGCTLVRQRDREALGHPLSRLSDREWQICLALEQPDGEKQIAAALSCSCHTVHSYVKSVYRKLGVQSRLQVLGQLKLAREQLRRRVCDTLDRRPGHIEASPLELPVSSLD